MNPVKGHTGEIYAVSFHPNGVLFASGGQDQKTLIWDLRASQQLSQLSINSGNIKKAALHPDGRQLIDLDCARFEGLLCLQDEARFWLISSNSISLVPGRQPLRDYRQMYDVQMSPDGSIVAIAGCQGEGSTSAPCFQHGVRLYLTGTGQPIGVPLEGHTDVISAMAFSPDGRILVTAARTAPSAYGMEPAVPLLERCFDRTPAGLQRWSSAQTAGAWSLRLSTELSACGIPAPGCPPANPCAGTPIRLTAWHISRMANTSFQRAATACWCSGKPQPLNGNHRF